MAGPSKGRTGRLIVIDGTDGSGKHTQTVRLVERLRASGVAAESLSFPQYGGSFFGELVSRYLRGEFGPAEAVDPRLASALFALDRWEARDRLCAWLDSGRVVVLDRYVSSNAGHQSIKIADPAARAEFVAWVERMEYEVLRLPRPDLVVFLHMPWQSAQELVGRKPQRAYLQGGRRDIHEADPEHLRLSELAYVDMAAANPSWRRVECVEQGRILPPEAVGEAVWRQVAPLLEGLPPCAARGG